MGEDMDGYGVERYDVLHKGWLSGCLVMLQVVVSVVSFLCQLSAWNV